MAISRIFLFASLTLLLSSLAYADAKEKDLDALLNSGSLSEQRTAFEKIASLPKQYVPIVRNRLAAIASGQLQPNEKSLDRLFYLAAFLKNKSLVPPMKTLWLDTDILPDYCVYSCPRVASFFI